MNYWVKDTEFIEFLKFFKTIKGIHKKDFQELRKFIEAVYYICKAGCPWRMLPDFYGNWRAVHKRFKIRQIKVFGKHYLKLHKKILTWNM